jgi:hypothetical protein
MARKFGGVQRETELKLQFVALAVESEPNRGHHVPRWQTKYLVA